MSSNLRLAFRNLRRNRRRTGIALSTIAFGVVALVLAGGFIEWIFWAMRTATIESQLGHVQVVRQGYLEAGAADPFAFLLPQESPEFEELKRTPGVEFVTPRIAFMGLVSHGDLTVSFAGDGVVPENEKVVSKWLVITDGENLSAVDASEVIMGSGLARNLGVSLGDTVVLLANTAEGGINAVSKPAARTLPECDAPAAERAVRDLLVALGEDPDRDGLADTPARVARAYAEMFRGLHMTADEVLTTTFDLGHDEMVLVKDIELYSTCEHHLVPFHGVAHVGYIPGEDGRITGLSKIARLVDVFAKRPQVQERLTTQIADSLMRILEPRGAIVVIEAEHLCMSMRGVRKPGARTVTSAVRGSLLAPATRAEAMSLILSR